MSAPLAALGSSPASLRAYGAGRVAAAGLFALLATARPVTVVSMGGPYDRAYFDAAPTYRAAYGYQPATLSRLVNVPFGTRPGGHLPATIHRADDPTKVLVSCGRGPRH